MIDELTQQRPRRDDCGSPMINLTYEDREELIIAAVTGVMIGFVGGYLDHSQGFGILVWTLVCAVIASGMVFCLRSAGRKNIALLQVRCVARCRSGDLDTITVLPDAGWTP